MERELAYIKKDKITQDNLHLILPFKVGYLAGRIANDQDLSVPEVIYTIYQSKLYLTLCDESSKYWLLEPDELYEKLQKELRVEQQS